MARHTILRYPAFILILSLLALGMVRCSSEQNETLNITTEQISENTYQISLAHNFLNFFFNELENGLDQVLQNTPFKDNKLVSTSTMASETTKLLKREVQQVMNDEIQKIDKLIFQKVIGVVTAGMVAASAYAYMI